MALRGLTWSAVMVALVGVACEYDPTAATGEAFSHCAGVPATIGIGWSESDGGDGSTYFGTEGDDIVVITNGPLTFRGMGGDDLICINETGLGWGPGDINIYLGSGDDTVHNFFSRPAIPGQYVFSHLGKGDDEYYGGPASEVVVGYLGADRILTGDGPDQIEDRYQEAGQFFDCGAGVDYVSLPLPDPAIVNCETSTALTE